MRKLLDLLPRQRHKANFTVIKFKCHNSAVCTSIRHQILQKCVAYVSANITANYGHTRMWANAQRDGRPAEYRWRPLFNAAVWLTPTTRVPCSNAAKTRNPLKLHGVPQTNETISAASGPKFTILWAHVEEILVLNKFFSRL